MSEYAENIQTIEDVWKKRIELRDGGGRMSEYIYASSGEPLANSDGKISLARKNAIVRCKDCEFYEPNTYSHFTCELLQFQVEPDGFCAWGERREL